MTKTTKHGMAALVMVMASLGPVRTAAAQDDGFKSARQQELTTAVRRVEDYVKSRNGARVPLTSEGLTWMLRILPASRAEASFIWQRMLVVADYDRLVAASGPGSGASQTAQNTMTGAPR